MSKIDALDEDDAEKTVTVLQHLITDAESEKKSRFCYATTIKSAPASLGNAYAI